MANPTLLFVPGTLCTRRVFTPQLQYFSSTHDVSVADISVGDSVAAIAQNILANAPSTFILTGLSMGGIIAFEIIRQAPERVIGLILLGTNARDDLPEKIQKRTLQLNAIENLEIQGQDGLSSHVEYSLFPNYTAQHCKYKQSIKHTVVLMAQESGFAVFKQQINALNTRIDSAPLLPNITVPVLIICGDEDILCPVSNHEYMAEHISQSTLFILPSCGHLSTLEQPKQINTIIENWLSQPVFTHLSSQ